MTTELGMPARITWDDRSEIRNRYRNALSGYAASSMLGRSQSCLSAQVRAESDALQ